jgi:hypothetical protein
VLVPIVSAMLSCCSSEDESLVGIFVSCCGEQVLLLRKDPSSAEGSRVFSLEEAISVAVGIVLILVCRKTQRESNKWW